MGHMPQACCYYVVMHDALFYVAVHRLSCLCLNKSLHYHSDADSAVSSQLLLLLLLLRVTAPQRDWCQGTIQLQPGKPQYLALEVSYILPVPAWFLHPCTCSDKDGRLALDLSTGFGSYVIDPRFLEIGQNVVGPVVYGGLERLELGGQLCWRPSRMAALLTRLLPGKSRGSRSSRQRAQRPSFKLTVSKASVWQVPFDNEQRFAEGFLFTAEQHKLEQLLVHYGILQHSV